MLKEHERMLRPVKLKKLSKHGRLMSLENFIENVKDGMFIDYDGWGYYVKNDTLFGRGIVTKKNVEQAFDGKIPLNDIESFQVNKLDGMTTAGLVIGLLIVSGVIIYAIVFLTALSVAIS